MTSQRNSFWNLMFKWSLNVTKAQQIKKDPVKREKSVWFGVIASSCAFFAIFLGVLFGFCLIGIKSDSALGNIFGWIGVIVSALGWIGSVVESFMYWSLQLSINKKPFTWISLTLVILFIIAAVVSAIVISTVW